MAGSAVNHIFQTLTSHFSPLAPPFFIRIAIFLNNDFILCFIVGLVQSSITFVSFSLSMRAKNVSRLGCLGAERI